MKLIELKTDSLEVEVVRGEGKTFYILKEPRSGIHFVVGYAEMVMLARIVLESEDK